MSHSELYFTTLFAALFVAWLIRFGWKSLLIKREYDAWYEAHSGQDDE